MVVLLEQDTLLCRCLQVSESALCNAIERCPMSNLQDVARETGAGSGCTACHRSIRRFLTQQRQSQQFEGQQFEAPSCRSQLGS
ncbi:MAG TPA: (2Fe-2S)-binding protein [Pirellulales bacterium]|jgi:bacterioferritin-associated ferredoxin|nr:(2Fe-2S)-binding protein [Pirellulales bacterium]